MKGGVVADPTVSIVITTRDRHQFAERAIECALGQSISDIEVIVVDDGSREPLRLPPADERLRLIRRNQSVGTCGARNLGMETARGSWITFLDDDDELVPHMVETSLGAVKDSDLPSPVAALSGIEVVDGAGRIVKTHLPVTLPMGGDYFLEDGNGRSFQTHNTLFVPTETLRDIGGFDEDIPGGWEHDDLFLRLNGVCSLQGVDTVTYRKTAHGDRQIHNDMLACARGMERTLVKHRETFSRYPRQWAHYRGSMGVAYLKAGRWAPAISATTRAVFRDPRQPRLFVWWLASLAGPRTLSWYRRGRTKIFG